MVSIKHNFFYSSLLTVANYLFPLITYPYVSRVLGVANIGVCNFVDSILQWFILFSMMGISIVGNREIAACRDDELRRSKVFSELILLNLSTTVIAIIVLIGAMYTVPSLFQYRRLLWIGVVKLTANFACIDWLFRGTELFKYITGRTILVKLLYVVAVFAFVHKAEDYTVYYLLSVLMIAGNAIINLLYSKQLVGICFHGLNLSRHVKPYLTLGLYMFLSSMYITFNVTYLGVATDEIQVGYYTTATKLHGIIIAFFSAFTGVMLPRMSSLLAEGRMEEFKKYIDKSFDLLLVYAVPLVFFFGVTAPEVVRLLAGAGYEGAILPTRIIMPLILIIGFEQIFVIQILMPLRLDREVFINSVVGAILGITLNLLLVKHLKSTGSAIVWLTCELSVLVMASYFTKKRSGISFPWRKSFRMFLVYFPSLIGCVLCYILIPDHWVRFAVTTLWMGIYVTVYVLAIRKDEMVYSLLAGVRKRLH